MAEFDTDVLIVGAGPTGLTLASELMRRGIACRIVDKNPKPATQSRALGIHARTLETFELMGILPDFLERGHVAHGVRMRADGKEVMHVRLDEVDSAYPFVLVLSQSETERMLAEHLASQGLTVERPVSLTTFTQDADGVTATLDHDGEAEATRARWIVGCDGAHSAVRHTLGLKFEGAPYAEQFMLADVFVDWEMSNEELLIWVAKPGLAAFFPMGNFPVDGVALEERRPRNLWRIVMSGGKDAAADAPMLTGHNDDVSTLTIDELRALVAERVDVPIDISDPQWTARFRVHRRIVDKMRVGHAFLAGDAADIHSPAGGQGMNTGIQSAHNLAWKLSMVVKGEAPESLLDTYHTERHPIEQDVLRGTDLLTKLVTSNGPLAHWVRDSLLPILSHQDFIQHRIMANVSEVAVGYRRSPIVEEHRIPDSNVRAGDHAPAASVVNTQTGETARVVDLIDPLRHTLLVLTGPVVERPLAGHESRVTADVEGFAPFLNTFSGIGGVAAMPGGVVGIASDSVISGEALYRVVAAGKTVEECYGDKVTCHLIVRDESQTYGYDWSCDTWVDRSDALHERYGRSEPSLYLIRPDGYIAFRGTATDVERLPAYLAKLFGEATLPESGSVAEAK